MKDYERVNCKKIAESLGYKNWGQIKEEIARKCGMLICTKKEKYLFRTYKNIPNNFYSFLNLEFAKFLVDGKTKQKILFEKIDLLEKICKGQPRVKIQLDKILYSPFQLYAYFQCMQCKKDFRVEVNTAKWITYFDIPLCKKCKKKLVHKCYDYKEKYENTMLKRFGVKRPLQSPKIHKKFKSTMEKNYGVSYSAQSPELLQKTWNNTIWKNKASKFEREIATVLEKKLSNEVKMRSVLSGTCKQRGFYSQEENCYYYPDIIIEDLLIIEAFGDYWHGNPKLYNEKDLVAHNEIAEELWEKDKRRLENIKKLSGLPIEIVWEYDWRHNQKEVLRKILKHVNN